MTFLNKFLLVIAFSLAQLLGFSQGYKLTFKVKGLKDTTCYLAFHLGDKQYLKDTAKVNSKGQFVFERKEKLDGGIYMVVLHNTKLFEFLVIEQNFSLETDTTDYVKHMKVKGSSENIHFFDYLRYFEPRAVKADSLQKSLVNAKDKMDSTHIKSLIEKSNKEIYNYRENVIKNNPKTFVATLFKAMTVKEPTEEEIAAAKTKGDSTFMLTYLKNHFFDNIDFSDDRILRTPIYQQKIKEYITNLTYPIVDSINKSADIIVAKAKANKQVFRYTVIWLTTTYETSNLMGADAVYVHMVEKYYMTKQAFWTDSTTLRKITDRAMLLKPLLIGKKAPQLVLADSNNQYYALHNIKAKYTIVYFWDPNCGHCQKETPKLYELYKKYKAEGVEVFAYNIGQERNKWVEYINKHDLQWLNVHDPNHTTNWKQLYDIYSTPVIYLLNEKKEIVAKRLGVEQLDEFLGNVIKYDKEKEKKTGK